jgi:hypothetical protein
MRIVRKISFQSRGSRLRRSLGFRVGVCTALGGRHLVLGSLKRNRQRRLEGDEAQYATVADAMHRNLDLGAIGVQESDYRESPL